jgi:hypothetical protein
MGTCARRITSTALRNSVPRLNHGFALDAPLGGNACHTKARLKYLHHGFNLHHGHAEFDGGAFVFVHLAAQLSVKLGQG